MTSRSERMSEIRSVTDRLKESVETRNQDSVRSNLDQLLAASKSLESGPNLSSSDVAAALWLIQASGERLLELASLDDPDWETIDVGCSFVESGFDRLTASTTDH